jgi:hypothetical protein
MTTTAIWLQYYQLISYKQSALYDVVIDTRRDEQRRKYSRIDKRAKDKLVRLPGENGGG